MWKNWIGGLVFGLFGALFLYLSIDKLQRAATVQNLTSNVDVAKTLAEQRALDAQLLDLTAKVDASSTRELDQDIANIKISLGNLADKVKKSCQPAAPADAASTAPSKAPAPTPKSAAPPAPFPYRDGVWDDVQRSVWQLQREYGTMEQRYLGGLGEASVNNEPTASLARSQFEDIMDRIQPALRPGYVVPFDSRELCATLQAHRALLSADSSPVVAPFARVKQRQENQRQDNVNRIKDLESRRAELKNDLAAQQKNLAEGPKLIVVKYLPLAMAIILAFGGLLFVAARLLDESVVTQLVQSGQLIQFPTVVILFAVILVLALAEGITKDHTATLLASIAGYILGSTKNGRAEPAGKKRDEAAPTAPPEGQDSNGPGPAAPDGQVAAQPPSFTST